MSSNAAAKRSFSAFTDLREVYAQMTATPEFHAAFGDVGALSITGPGEEPEELGMPDELDAQADCAGIICTIFDLFRDTRLEASSQAIAWGIVNSFHYEAQKLDRLEDSLSRELGDMIRAPDLSEVYNTQLGLRLDQSQKATAVARATAERKLAASLS